MVWVIEYQKLNEWHVPTALVITFSSPSLMEAVACTDIPNIDNNAYEDDRDLVIQLSPVTERVTAMGSATITVRDDDGETHF